MAALSDAARAAADIAPQAVGTVAWQVVARRQLDLEVAEVVRPQKSELLGVGYLLI
jgi:hypothetical protein